MKHFFAILMHFMFTLNAEAATDDCGRHLVRRDPAKSFEVRILEGIFKDSGTNNVFITAPALNTALAMVVQGTKGPAQIELLQALGYNADELNGLNADVVTSIQAMNRQGNGIRISAASAFWSDTSLALNPNFVADIRKIFNAPVETLPFALNPEEAAQEINDWASAQTNNMIPEIINADNAAGTAALLASAVYVKVTGSTNSTSRKPVEVNSEPSKVKLLNPTLWSSPSLKSTLM